MRQKATLMVLRRLAIDRRRCRLICAQSVPIGKGSHVGEREGAGARLPEWPLSSSGCRSRCTPCSLWRTCAG